MGSWAAIELDGMTLQESKNYYYEWYFRKSDRSIVRVPAEEYYGDPAVAGEESVSVYQYVMPAATLRRRLNLAGFNRQSLEHEFKRQREQLVEDMANMALLQSDGDAARFLPIVKSSTLDEWISRLRMIHERKLKSNLWVSEKQEFDDELLTLMLRNEDVFFSDRPSAGYYNFPCQTTEGYAVALLEFLPNSAQCILDVTSLVDGGWTDAFDDLEEYHQEFTRFCQVFKASIEDARDLMKLAPENGVLARMIYANVITAMETYLADTLKKQVLSRPSIERKFVQSHGGFKRAIPVTKIFDTMDGLKDEIVAEIDKMSFHNLNLVPALYKSVLDTEFPPYSKSDLSAAVAIRHDIVHRNGKNTSGKSVDVTMNEVGALIALVDEVVVYIDKQVKDGLLDDVEID